LINLGKYSLSAAREVYLGRLPELPNRNSPSLTSTGPACSLIFLAAWSSLNGLVCQVPRDKPEASNLVSGIEENSITHRNSLVTRRNV
jgi:hypothetical protein